MKILAVLAAVALYVLFSFTAMFAGLQGLLVLVFRPRMTAAIMHSMDMLLAAQLGWDGRSTVSKECGVELAGGNPTRFCSSLCKVLSKLDPQHCEKEAR
jgi:hypothetical protein